MGKVENILKYSSLGLFIYALVYINANSYLLLSEVVYKWDILFQVSKISNYEPLIWMVGLVLAITKITRKINQKKDKNDEDEKRIKRRNIKTEIINMYLAIILNIWILKVVRDTKELKTESIECSIMTLLVILVVTILAMIVRNIKNKEVDKNG